MILTKQSGSIRMSSNGEGLHIKGLSSLSEMLMGSMTVARGNLFRQFFHLQYIVLFRTVKLCQDFLGTTTKEDKLQNTFQVVSRVRAKTRSQKKTKSSLKLIPTGMN